MQDGSVKEEGMGEEKKKKDRKVLGVVVYVQNQDPVSAPGQFK